MKLLVTGSRSRLGRHVARSWENRPDLELVLTDWDKPPAVQDGAIQAVDFSNPEELQDLLSGVNHVLHLDALTYPVEQSIECSDQLFRSLCGLYNLVLAAQVTGVERFILGSTLSFFDRLPESWQVNEVWRPLPLPDLTELIPWLSELSLRETVRVGRMLAVCLRFGPLTTSSEMRNSEFDPRWVHVDDALHAVDRAINFDAVAMRNSTRPDWHLFHIAAPGPFSKIKILHETGGEQRAISAAEPFSYKPQHEIGPTNSSGTWKAPDSFSDWPHSIVRGKATPSKSVRKVVIFGAGGPMGASTALAMQHGFELRLCDLRGIEEIRSTQKGQKTGRPITPHLLPPHEHRIVDMCNADQVVAACADMDAIINCSVLRPRLHEAFNVNAAGAFNVARGAVQHGIRRVVQTGPFQQMDPGYGSYVWDYDVPVEAPARPLAYLYHHTKYLGQEALRVFAEHHDLEVAVMLFWRLVIPGERHQIPPFAISWEDSGRALRRAVEAPALPSSYEEFNVSADMPHRRFRHSKLRDVLGFEARDKLMEFWQD